ncbi:MAG: glycosyltransferase family 39 protein [Actinomycetota bacterium]
MGVTVLAAVLGFLHLGDKPLAQDEATSWFIAQLDWSGLWEAVTTSEANAGIYYGLLHFWITFGESEVALRTLSVLCGIATIPVLYALGIRLFDRIPALIGSVLLAVNAFFIENVQDARGYSMATLLITTASYLFVRLLWQPSKGRTVAYVLLSVLAVYAHFFAVLVIGAHVLSLAFVRRDEIPFRSLLPAYAAMGLLIAPLVGFSLTNDVGQIAWISDPTWTRLMDGLKDLTGRGGIPVLVGYGVAFVLGVAAAIRARRSGRSSFDGWRYAFLFLWVFVPIAVSFGFSYIKPIFEPRYLMGVMPAIALLGAAGLWVIRVRVIPIAAVALAMVPAAQAVDDWYDTGAVRWAAGVRQIVQNTEPRDGMVFYAPTMLRPYLYYAERLGVEEDFPEFIYPTSYEWLGFSRTRYHPDYEAIRQRAEQHGRVWLVKGKEADEPRREEAALLRDTLAGACPEIVGELFKARIVLYGGCS